MSTNAQGRPRYGGRATESFAEKGIDVSPFIPQVEDGVTLLFPVTNHASDVHEIMIPAMDEVLGGNPTSAP